MKRNILTLTAAALFVLGVFAVVQAQGPYAGAARGHGLERLTEGLNLTPDQKAKVQPIIEQAQPQVAAIHREAREKMKTVIDNTASQIRPLLTPEQQKMLDENLNAHRGRMKGRNEPSDTMDE